MSTLLVAVSCLVVGAAISALVVWLRLARQLHVVAAALDPDAPRLPGVGFSVALRQVQRWASRSAGVSAELGEKADLVRRAVDSLTQGVVVAGSDGKVVVRNVAAERFLGIRYADALVDDVVQELLRSALVGQSRQQAIELYGPPRRTVVVSAVPVQLAGRAIAAMAEIEDVTERARLEAMRTDFVANISHELRTPVGAIALLAETITGEDDPAVMARLADRMVLESHRVGRIIEDLLELSRIEIGGVALREVVSVGLIASEAVERVRHLADHRGTRIVVHDPSRRINVVGDRRQLVSAVANLVENGVKYSDRGSSVVVSARSDGTWAEITVEDHGIGIPDADLDRVFERFYRVDRARSRETGGTGLGLAIVRHVATNHGGTVGVRSHEGSGSTFVLRLPAGPGPVSVALPDAS